MVLQDNSCASALAPADYSIPLPMDRSDSYLWRSCEVARLISLLESERRYYEDIVTLLPAPIALVEANGQFISGNRAFLKHFNIRAAELAAIGVARLLPSLPLTPGLHHDWELFRLQRRDDETSDLVLVQRTRTAPPPPPPDPAVEERAANQAATAARLGCRPSQLLDASASLVPFGPPWFVRRSLLWA